MLRSIFAFFHFPISHSSVIHWKICVKDFSATSCSRIFKFGTNVKYDLFYCVRENQPPPIYHSLYLSIFLSLQIFWQISQLLREPEFSNFVYTLRVAKYMVRKKTKMLFAFFLFSISHSNVIHREICIKGFSGTTMPRLLTFGTNVGYDLLYCVKENQPHAAYHSLYLSIFLSLQPNFLLQISQLLWEIVFKFCVLLDSGQVYCVTRNKTDKIYFAFFFLFSIFHSNLIHREICDKYFSGTIESRIL